MARREAALAPKPARMMMLLFRERSSTSCVAVAVGVAGALAGMGGAAYGDDGDSSEPSDPETSEPLSTSRRAEVGSFLPSGLAARNEGGGLVTVMAGWNQARKGAIYDTTAQAQILGPVSLRGGAVDGGPGTQASLHLELQLDALRQATSGVDVAVAAGYVEAGFSNVPAAALKVAVGRNVGATYLLGNVVYEQGLQGGERSGEARAAMLLPVGRDVHVGIDSRFQIDLERDDDEPVGEAEWESRSGLVASYAWNRLILTGGAGVSALRFRTGGPMAVGPVVTAGFATVF